MTTTTLTLTDFLLARIAEDERAFVDQDENLGMHMITVAAHDRWLRECKAKRRIVGMHENDGGSCGTCTDSDYLGLVDDWPCDTLKALALPYADHPDYREEWRP